MADPSRFVVILDGFLFIYFHFCKFPDIYIENALYFCRIK